MYCNPVALTRLLLVMQSVSIVSLPEDPEFVVSNLKYAIFGLT